MTTLLVVEDHALVREGLVQTLHQLGADVEVLEADGCASASVLLETQGGRIDLMLLDLGLPGIDGISCLRVFRKRYSRVPVVILSAHDDAHTVSTAMSCGAAGFVSKACSSDRLLESVREVLAGGELAPVPFTPGSVAHSPIGAVSDAKELGLSRRRTEVLSLMVHGKSNREIAELLGLAEGTIKVHLTAIFKALKVTSRTQAMVVAARHGIKL